MIKLNTSDNNQPVMFQCFINYGDFSEWLILLYDVNAFVVEAYRCHSNNPTEVRRCLCRGLKELPTFYLAEDEFEDTQEEVTSVLKWEGMQQIDRGIHHKLD